MTSAVGDSITFVAFLSSAKYLDHGATARLISAFVLSLLDNGNSLLVGLTEKQLDRLTSVQNAAVRLINWSSRTEHIKPQLKALHWLPVRSRIDFKIATLAFLVERDIF